MGDGPVSSPATTPARFVVLSRGTCEDVPLPLPLPLPLVASLVASVVDVDRVVGSRGDVVVLEEVVVGVVEVEEVVVVVDEEDVVVVVGDELVVDVVVGVDVVANGRTAELAK